MAKKEKSPAELALDAGRLVYDHEGNATLTLSKPIAVKLVGRDQVVSQEDHATITLREATAGDLEILDSEEGQVAGGLAIIAALSGLPKKSLKALTGRDFAVLSEVCAGFTPDGLPIGDKS